MRVPAVKMETVKSQKLCGHGQTQQSHGQQQIFAQIARKASSINLLLLAPPGFQSIYTPKTSGSVTANLPNPKTNPPSLPAEVLLTLRADSGITLLLLFLEWLNGLKGITSSYWVHS